MSVPEGMEEVPMEQVGPPAVETVIRSAAVNVRKMDTPEGPITFLTFFTPVMAYTYQLDYEGAKAVSDALRPSEIVPVRTMPPELK
jgi:hypothetical protein